MFSIKVPGRRNVDPVCVIKWFFDTPLHVGTPTFRVSQNQVDNFTVARGRVLSIRSSPPPSAALLPSTRNGINEEFGIPDDAPATGNNSEDAKPKEDTPASSIQSAGEEVVKQEEQHVQSVIIQPDVGHCPNEVDDPKMYENPMKAAVQCSVESTYLPEGVSVVEVEAPADPI